MPQTETLPASIVSGGELPTRGVFAEAVRVRPDPDAGRRLKTRDSRRTVPIHPELIRIGVLDFATRQREAGHDRLFPELQPDRRGSYSGDFQRWTNRWLDRIGAKGDRQSFHSTRHAFTDALRRAGATGEIIDGVLGWSRGNMRDRYGSGPWIMMLAEVMQRVEYPLDLSHLCVRRPAWARRTLGEVGGQAGA